MNSYFALGAMLLGSSFSIGADSPGAPPTQPSSEEIAKAVNLVAELGDTRFRVRENAARELKKLGRSAKQALLDGTKSPDAEIWNRCNQLLPEILALDLRARVDAYLEDADGKFKHEVPMLDRFKKICGSDPVARKLFVEIIRTNAELLEDCERNPTMAGEIYYARAQEIHKQIWGQWTGAPRPPINAADLAALLLIGADQKISKQIAENALNPVPSFLDQQPIKNALGTGALAPPYRKLLFAWADNQRDSGSIDQLLTVIKAHRMKEGVEFAVKVMKSKESQTWLRAQALIVIGQIGGKAQLADVAALFGDKTQVATIQWNSMAITTQIRDVALAMALQLSGQSVSGYGFDVLETNAGLLWAYHYLGFSTEERRSAAFRKWKEWSDARKNEESKKEEPYKKK